MAKKILALAFLGILTFIASAQNSQAACPGPEFLGSPYETGETIRLRGVSSVNPWFLCLYDPKGNLANYTVSQSNPTPSTISYTADTLGIWTGVVLTGSEFTEGLKSTSCPDSLEGRTIACSVTTNVTASTTTPPTTPTMPTEPITPTPPTNSGYKCINKDNLEIIDSSGNYSYSECDNVCKLKDIGDYCSESPCTTGYTCSTAEEACACSAFEEETEPTTPTTPTTPATPTTPTAGIGTSPATGGSYANPLPGIHTLTEAATVMIQAILGLIGTIALLFLIIAGIMYITAAGEEEKIKAAKRIITGTIVGLGIALLAFSFLQVIVDILG
jgi:hypothetical protein